MEKKALHILEFDKILNKTAEYTGNEAVKQRILDLMPASSLGEAEAMQQQTSRGR